MPVPTAVAPSGTASRAESAAASASAVRPERVGLAAVRVGDAERHGVLQTGAPEVLGVAHLLAFAISASSSSPIRSSASPPTTCVASASAVG